MIAPGQTGACDGGTDHASHVTAKAGQAPRTLGQAIYRIEHDWPINEDAGAKGRKDYVGGEFAEFIKS